MNRFHHGWPTHHEGIAFAAVVVGLIGTIPGHNATITSGPFKFDYLLGENKFIKSGADVVFLDYDLPRSVLNQYKTSGKRVICYVNVGAWEDWRSDADAFPPSVRGKDYQGWPGEKWLDIRRQDILLPIMRKRYQLALSKGCEGIDPDNMNGYSVNSGFPLTYQEQLSYNRAVSQMAHELGIMAGIKNTNEMADDLIKDVDFAVLEECVRWDECNYFDSYISSGKPVFGVEYTDDWTTSNFRKNVCPLVNRTKMSFILKRRDLRGDFIVSCL